MAADPSAVDPFIDPVTIAAQLLEDELLGIIAAGVAAGLSTVAIRTRLARRVQLLAPGLLQVAGQAIVDSFTAGVQAADDDVRAARKVKDRRAPSPKPLRLLLGRVLKEAPRLMARTIDLANLAIRDGLAQDRFGTRKAAASALLARYAADGVTGFQDASGRRWDLVTYAETVTRTTAVQTLVDAHLQRLTDRGHDLVIVSDTPAECELCRPYEGKVLSISGATRKGTKLADGVRVYDSIAGAKSAGVWHPNAILGDQNCTVLGQVENGVTCRYDGPSVHLTTARGNRLTVSPNHPVLTASGWVPADLLRQGQQVFRSVTAQLERAVPVAEEHLDHGPSTFQQVLDALGATGHRARVAVAADDFHGDGRHYEREVDVVWADRPLLDVLQPVGVEQVRQLVLAGTDMQTETLPGLSPLHHSLHAVAGSVARTLADLDTTSLQPAPYGGFTDGESAGDVLGRLSCEVATDKIVNVERGWYSGQAFDLQTSTGAYATDGIIVSNCRHRAGIYLPGRTKPFGETRDPDGARLRDQQRYRERKVREKQRKLLAVHAIDPRSDETRAAVADLRAYQQNFAAWRKTNGLKNQTARTSLTVR